MVNNTDQVLALANELQQAAAGEDIPSAAAAYADCAGRLRTLAKSLASAPPSAPDDVNRLVRELDVALNGPEGAAAQASLCDLVGQVQRIVRERGAPLLATSAPVGVDALLGFLPAPLTHSQAWPQGYVDGFNACAKLAEEQVRIALAQQPAAVDEFKPQEGEPPTWFEEWFIAKLDTGERVVLRRLPEEWTYDYTTADQTYYKARRLKWWMQFPDSAFVPLESKAQQPAVVDALEVFRIAGGDTECEPNPTPGRALEVLRDLRACYDEALAQQPAAPSGEAVATVIGYDPWSRVAVDWHRNDLAPGTKLYAAPQQPAGVMPDGISDDVIKAVWRAAMTSAHNVCVNRSNRWNDDDGPDDRITEANECAKEIAHWLEADEWFIAEIRADLAAQQQGGAR